MNDGTLGPSLQLVERIAGTALMRTSTEPSFALAQENAQGAAFFSPHAGAMKSGDDPSNPALTPQLGR